MFSTGPMAVALVVALAILGLVSPPAAAQCQGSTAGCSTGGGKIIPPGPSLEQDVTFGFEFHGSPDSALEPPKGTCLIVDSNLDVRAHCLDPFAYVQMGPSASIWGNADVNGVLTVFRMDVTDGADTFTQDEPDTFAFVTASGYAVTGVVFDGNIDVHH
jgi:hypothetical protein